MVFKAYRWLHARFARAEERGRYSSGYWQDMVRREALALCRGARGRLIEIGCGEGLFLIPLALARPDLDIAGVDLNTARLEECRVKTNELRIKNIRLIVQDGTSLDLGGEVFDTVVCINVFINIASAGEMGALMAAMTRVCARGGRIIFEFRNALNALLRLKYRLAPMYDETVRDRPLATYLAEDVARSVDKAGFDLVDTRYVSFPPGRYAPIVFMVAKKR